jgi:hypothetical protein
MLRRNTNVLERAVRVPVHMEDAKNWAILRYGYAVSTVSIPHRSDPFVGTTQHTLAICVSTLNFTLDSCPILLFASDVRCLPAATDYVHEHGQSTH